jgi:hypothetical protein
MRGGSTSRPRATPSSAPRPVSTAAYAPRVPIVYPRGRTPPAQREPPRPLDLGESFSRTPPNGSDETTDQEVGPACCSRCCSRRRRRPGRIPHPIHSGRTHLPVRASWGRASDGIDGHQRVVPRRCTTTRTITRSRPHAGRGASRVAAPRAGAARYGCARDRPLSVTRRLSICARPRPSVQLLCRECPPGRASDGGENLQNPPPEGPLRGWPPVTPSLVVNDRDQPTSRGAAVL